MVVNHCFVDESYDRAGNTNIAIAAMVTGYARMKLYSIIDEIQSSNEERVLYFDTDSVIFKDKPGSGWTVPEIGDFLGDMTDEVTKDYGPGSYIDMFTSGGPKNYAYNVVTPNGRKTVTKVKGINITYGLKDVLNFETVSHFAKEYRKGNKEVHLMAKQLQFSTDKYHEVSTNVLEKKYRAVSDKRVIVNDERRPFHTIPYGYKFTD